MEKINEHSPLDITVSTAHNGQFYLTRLKCGNSNMSRELHSPTQETEKGLKSQDYSYGVGETFT